MKNTNIIKLKLDSMTLDFLRKKGGFHTTKKGKKGYNRNQEKESQRRG